ncbi:MAG: carbamate kinase [Erysipelotrichales bacterium]|nr:carbamate kinase [Erysipelotrichales bacterium]
MSRIVVALGGNALGNNPVEQLALVKETAKPLVDLIAEGHELIIAHGNGPQVGMINLAMDAAANSEAKTPEMPFPECGAMSQGYIGYHLQNALYEELANRNINKTVAAIVTQVQVDENDPAFQNATKPIGRFYTKEEADELVATKGFTMKEDAGRGYRRVVASPKPVDIIEKDLVRSVVEAGYVAITVGGGGIPVIKKGNSLVGVPAVIDKDFASAKIAEILNADYLFILTAVDRVMINFNKPDCQALETMTIAEAEKYIEEGHFAPGSMLPKVQAAMSFVNSGDNRQAIIASLEKAALALKGESGTKVTK